MDIKTINTPVVSGRNNEAGKTINGESAATSTTHISSGTELGSSIDKVTLTDVQSQIRALEKKAHSVDSENSERIAQLREAVSNGSYQVDAQKVADKLMQTEAMFARF